MSHVIVMTVQDRSTVSALASLGPKHVLSGFIVTLWDQTLSRDKLVRFFSFLAQELPGSFQSWFVSRRLEAGDKTDDFSCAFGFLEMMHVIRSGVADGASDAYRISAHYKSFVVRMLHEEQILPARASEFQRLVELFRAFE